MVPVIDDRQEYQFGVNAHPLIHLCKLARDFLHLVRAAIVDQDISPISTILVQRAFYAFGQAPFTVMDESNQADERLIRRCHGATSKGRDVLHSSSPLARSEAAQAWPLRNTRADL